MRRVGATVNQAWQGSKQVAKPGMKPAAKPQWRVPTLPKPVPREVFRQQQPAAPEQTTWRTFDAVTVKVRSSF